MLKIPFTVQGKDFEAHLENGWITSQGKDRRTITCILIGLPERSVNAGVAICHPCDDYDRKFGYQLAFKRAIAQRYTYQLLSNGQRYLREDWLKYWHEMRKAFGKELHLNTEVIPF